MKSAAFRMICRFLVALLSAMSFGPANAGMIGVERLATSTSVSEQGDRAALTSLVNRADVASELRAQGIDPQMAVERIAAMTDAEVHALRGQVETLPAGADFGVAAGIGPSGTTVALVAILIGILVWALWRVLAK